MEECREVTKFEDPSLQNKVVQKLQLSKIFNSKICSPDPIFLKENKFQKYQDNF